MVAPSCVPPTLTRTRPFAGLGRATHSRSGSNAKHSTSGPLSSAARSKFSLKRPPTSAMPEADHYVRRPVGSCAGWPRCREPALPGAAGCAEHDPIYLSCAAELKIKRPAPRGPALKPPVAPVTVTRVDSENVRARTVRGAESVARVVHAKGSATIAELVAELSIPNRTAGRWGAYARSRGWITSKPGDRAGYRPADAPPAEHAAAAQPLDGR